MHRTLPACLKRRSHILALSSIILLAPRAHAQEFILELGEPERFAPELELGLPIDISIGPDGSVVIADMADNALTKLSSSGEVLWRRGRYGRGPLEFQTLYRVSVSRRGTVIAFDISTNEITWISPDGDFERRHRLPFPLTVSNLAVLDQGGIAISGVTNWGNGSDNSVHLFDDSLQYLHSFGPLPQYTNRRALDYWGSGSITVMENGHIAFSRRGPYEIYIFSESGERITTIKAPFELGTNVDEAYIEERLQDGHIQISQSKEFMPRPMAATDLGNGWLLAGRLLARNSRTWDLFDPEGELIDALDLPSSLYSLSAVDRRRKVMYVKSETEIGEPIYLCITYSISKRRTS